jgi:hypothetical protein
MCPAKFEESSPLIINDPQEPGLSEAPITATDSGFRKTSNSHKVFPFFILACQHLSDNIQSFEDLEKIYIFCGFPQNVVDLPMEEIKIGFRFQNLALMMPRVKLRQNGTVS